MNYIWIGKIVNTHGIKGELRILSDIDNKKLIFKTNNKLYFGDNKEEHTIKNYRVHKNYDMVLIDDYHNINDVLKFKGIDVYTTKQDNIILVSELVGYKILFNDNSYGEVIDVIMNKLGYILKVKNDKEYYIPYNDHFINNIDKESKSIIINNIDEVLL